MKKEIEPLKLYISYAPKTSNGVAIAQVALSEGYALIPPAHFSVLDEADLMIAVLDGNPPNVYYEMGYAFARHIPIFTYSERIITKAPALTVPHFEDIVTAHLSSVAEVRDVLKIGNPRLGFASNQTDFGAAIAEIQNKYRMKRP